MQKKSKKIIIAILILIVGIIIGVLSTYLILNTNKKEETPTIERLKPEDIKYYSQLENLKVSPYTLDELYEIVEKPDKYYELNSSTVTVFNYVMFNFYKFFNTKTPVKVATKVKKDGTNVIEVLEVEYIDYSEYQRRMAEAYEIHNQYEEMIKGKKDKNGDPLKPSTPYGYFIDLLLYGDAEEIK